MFQAHLTIPDGLTNVTAITSLKMVLVHSAHILIWLRGSTEDGSMS
jgi:hypothetical protein